MPEHSSRTPITYSDLMEAETPEQAKHLLNAAIKQIQEEGSKMPEAEIRRNLLGNIGYMAGFYDHQTRTRIERIYGCQHPILGRADPQKPPTPEECIRKGMEPVRRKH